MKGIKQIHTRIERDLYSQISMLFRDRDPKPSLTWVINYLLKKGLKTHKEEYGNEA